MRLTRVVQIGLLKGKATQLDSEIETCLSRLTEVFVKYRESHSRWFTSITEHDAQIKAPVILLDELHSVDPSAVIEESSEFGKLLRWALFVTEAGLAHVIFVTRPDVDLALDR